MDGVRTAVVIWVATLCAPLAGLLVGGPAHAWPACAAVAVLFAQSVLATVFVQKAGLRGWSWRTTKAAGIVPAAWGSAWYGLPAGAIWVEAMPFLGASLLAVLLSTGLVLSSPLGRSFQRWTWLPAIDADALVRERFAAACWQRGLEPVDLDRTLSSGGDALHLVFANDSSNNHTVLEAAKEEARRAVQWSHRGRLWPAHWDNTIESPDLGDSIRLDMALARGEGLLTALHPSAHERMAVLARHTGKAI